MFPFLINPVEPCQLWAVPWAISKHCNAVGYFSSIPVNGQRLPVLSTGYLWGKEGVFTSWSLAAPPRLCTRQIALKGFIATPSCLSEFSHVGDVPLYGQLTLIVIVCLKHSKTTVGGKIPTPHLDGPSPSPQALLVYLHSKLKIWITSLYCLPKHSSCQALGCLHLYYLNLMLIMFFIYKEQAFTLPVWGYAALTISKDLAQGRGRGEDSLAHRARYQRGLWMLPSLVCSSPPLLRLQMDFLDKKHKYLSIYELVLPYLSHWVAKNRQLMAIYRIFGKAELGEDLWSTQGHQFGYSTNELCHILSYSGIPSCAMG